MDIKYYKELVSKLDLSFANKDIKSFIPKISKSFTTDKESFTKFWKTCTSTFNTLKKNYKIKK